MPAVKTAALITTLTASLLTSGAAHAKKDREPDHGIYVSPGVLVGGAKTFEGGTGLSVGGEVSVSYFMGGAVGGVVDGLYDLEREAGRVMVGPMLTFGTWGFDGGYLLEVGEGSRHGGAFRAFVTLGYVCVYLRYGALVDARDYVEGGLLLKLPLNVSPGKPWLYWP
jgi:hypothetical protein